ncbi:hypothetical protein JYT48_01795 [Mariprofundus ferrooxydans]|nr:hypothetical protein [Mariprofundus ferrooxydans]
MQLNTDLRLHPQRLSLGKAELLTDAITLPFTDIDSRLGFYALGATELEKRQLRSSMKNYLGRLNANPHIPLKFRLKVLARFEQELDLFDAEMTAAVLNAHKVGVALVQEAARHDASYFPTLIDMISNAIELAIKLQRIDLEHYRAPAVIVTRQFFELAKLALEVSTRLDTSAPCTAAKITRLHKSICNHEFLRSVDFFSHNRAQQAMIWHELQYHIQTVQAYFYHKDQVLLQRSKITMLINLNRPHESAQTIRAAMPNAQHIRRAPFNCIAMPLDHFITRLGKGIRSVKEVLGNQQQQQALHTEDALKSTMIGGKAILLAMKTEKRHHPRQSQSTIKIHLNKHLAQSMISAFSMQTSSMQASPNEPPTDTCRTWNIVDINAHGACLERLHIKPQNSERHDELANYLGEMIGLNWHFGEPGEQHMAKLFPAIKPPALAFIRWVKEHKAGEQRIGISFFHQHALENHPDQATRAFQMAKAVILGGSNDLQEKRTWPIMIQPNSTSYFAIFPDSKIYKNMSFSLVQDQHSQYYTVQSIIVTGANYTRCDIIPAKSS